MEEIKIEVFGRVQGVGFRHFIRENAEKLDLKGYVMNKDDGSVLVVAQGDKESLELFLQNVQVGPALAKVIGVSYFWSAQGKRYNDFIIALDKSMIKDQKRNFMNLGKKILNIKSKVPRHVAIIPDGNRRWAREKGFKEIEGHYRSSSYDKTIDLFEEAERLGAKYLTFWGFSTENWERSHGEINGIFDIVLKSAKKLRKDAEKNQVRFRHLGRRDRLPKKLVNELKKLEEETKNFDKFNVQLCLDYGGRDEIVRAVNKILKSGVSKIEEDDLVNYLDSAGIPDPDLIIRTSGENRISGFMPIQSVYSEFYFTNVCFPDFGPKHLKEAVEEFVRRRRRFGK